MAGIALLLETFGAMGARYPLGMVIHNPAIGGRENIAIVCPIARQEVPVFIREWFPRHCFAFPMPIDKPAAHGQGTAVWLCAYLAPH